MDRENPIEPACSAAVESIADECSLGFLENVESDKPAKLREIWLLRVNALEIIDDFTKRNWLISDCGSTLFDIFGHLRQRRSAVGARKLQTVVFGGIVAGGHVDSAIELPM